MRRRATVAGALAPRERTAPTLALFVKAPVAGRVKTRLAADLGPCGTVAAAWWYRHQVARLARRLGRDRRWRTVLAVAPDTAVASPALPALPRLAQGPGDLGARMARVLRSLGPGPVLVVGSDIPAIAPDTVARALGLLGEAEAVLGPAPDGGYWLIGLGRGARLASGALTGVRWSGPHALADTAASLAPLRLAYADTLADVDRAADLGRG